MSAAASIRLTPEQRTELEEALNDFESHIVSRGAALMRERAVRSIRSIENGSGIEAQVQGGVFTPPPSSSKRGKLWPTAPAPMRLTANMPPH
ncbi:MAG: hypothetical protein OJI67_19405 [Prosthecobacter sp.]|nr:hypothetical protein [Prosthecobacter sp.]